ncbi:hypothetical protein JCM33374_g1193 [Metschnikowia sp. JCM 33374]|nr:hypothetical protein JCM33374_g1193 [Metschnikowia sp. JCM 33374]
MRDEINRNADVGCGCSGRMSDREIGEIDGDENEAGLLRSENWRIETMLGTTTGLAHSTNENIMKGKCDFNNTGREPTCGGFTPW